LSPELLAFYNQPAVFCNSVPQFFEDDFLLLWVQKAAVFNIKDNGDFGVELVYILSAGAGTSAGFEYNLIFKYLDFAAGGYHLAAYALINKQVFLMSGFVLLQKAESSIRRDD